jgi:hypothetical protein
MAEHSPTLQATVTTYFFLRKAVTATRSRTPMMSQVPYLVHMLLAIFVIIKTLDDPYDNSIWEPLFAGIRTEILSGNSNVAQLLGLLLTLRQPQQADGLEYILDWEARRVLLLFLVSIS